MAMMIPQIYISLAPPEDLPVEPYSPFAKTAFQLPQQEDSFRPVHLTPPPTHSKFRRPLGSPEDEPAKDIGRGLDRMRFEALLNASKESPAAIAARKSMDLRKEVALKVHKNKQAERRARFLSKVLAPPSPTATTTPVTPPESPAVFHYSLPSPGLVSPLAHYESLHEENKNTGLMDLPCKPWVEQVDFKLLTVQPKKTGTVSISAPPVRGRKGLPSLEQISARLNTSRSISIQKDIVVEREIQSAPAQAQLRVVGRLKMPVRSNVQTPSITVTDTAAADTPVAVPFPKPKPQLRLENLEPPSSPLLTSPSELKITTLVVPRTQSVSPTELTRVNLLALNSREKRSSVMLATLGRRTQSTALYGLPAAEVSKRTTRRHSAPPDSMPLRERKGFEHPVLALPGGF